MQFDENGVKEVYAQVIGAKVWLQQAFGEATNIRPPEGFSQTNLISQIKNSINDNIEYINNVLNNIDSAASEILGAEYRNKRLLSDVGKDRFYLAKVLNDPSNYEGLR